MMPRSKLITVFYILVLLVALPIGIYLVSHPQIFKPKAAGTLGVDIKLSPVSQTVAPGSEFTVDIQMVTNSLAVSASQIKINYPSDYLLAETVEIKDFLPVNLAAPKISTGSALLVQGSNPDSPKNGTGTIARITFKALQSSASQIPITFDTQNTQVAETSSNDNVLGTLTNANVQIQCTQPQIPTNLSPQGNIQEGTQNISWGSSQGANQYKVQVDDLSNSFNCSSLSAGDICQSTPSASLSYQFKLGHKYDIKVHSESTCGGGSSSQDASSQVLVPYKPDFDTNGFVDIFDYGKLLTDFGKSGSLLTDINGNGIVDIFDYNQLVKLFGKSFLNP